MNSIRWVLLFAMAPMVHCATSSESVQPEDQDSRIDTASWRNEVPGPGNVVMPRARGWKRDSLSNGLQVKVLEMPGLPIVTVALVTRGGWVADPASSGGLTWLTYQLLEYGTGGLNAYEVERRIRNIDADFFTSVERHYGMAGLHGFGGRVEDLITLLGYIVRYPDFPEETVRQRTQSAQTFLRRAERTSDQLMEQQLRKRLFSTPHPYGRPPWGTRRSWSRMTRNNLVDHHRAYFRPEESLLLLAGDVKAADIRVIARKAFSDWTGNGRAVSRPRQPGTKASSSTSRRIILIDRPAASQSSVCLARSVSAPSAELRGSVAVAASILESRLEADLRGKKGYTYGVDVHYDSAPLGDAVRVCTRLARAHTADALMRIIDGMSAFSREAEFAQAASATVRSAVINTAFSSTTLDGYVVSEAIKFAHEAFKGTTRRLTAQKLLKLETKTIEAAARRYFDPTTYQIVLTGDARRIRADLEALQFAELTVLRR